MASKDAIKFYPDTLTDLEFKQKTLAPGQSIMATITDVTKIKACQYLKIVTDMLGSISDANNYKSGPDIIITEVYSDDDINKKVTRIVSITPVSSIEFGGTYIDTTILETIDHDMYSLTIKAINNTQDDLIINYLWVYRSQDIQDGQLAPVITQVTNMYGLVLENRTTDPVNPAIGRIWIRTDLA
jgi:hypothetical protein